MEKLLDWIDKILMVDVFLVVLGFIWFAIALIGRSTGLPLGWDLWYSLWQPLFNPAIALLITGAIFTWAVKKVGERWGSKE